MAKENIPNTPIPVGDMEGIITDDKYCASRLDYSDNSFSNITKELVDFLENEYDNIGYGGNTRSFIAKDSNVNEIRSLIIDQNISGITSKTIGNHVILNQLDSDVIIFVNIY